MTEYEQKKAEREQARTEAAEAALQGGGATTSDYYYYNNNRENGTGRICRKIWTPEEGERILEAYTDNVSDTMTQAVARMIEGAYQAGLTVDEIVMAIEETGFAPRPSPRYLKAILRNWIESGRSVSFARHYSETNNSRIAWWRPNGK